MEDAVEDGVRRRRWPRRLGIFALAVGLLFAIAFAIVWPMREGLVRSYIDEALAKRGVRASYQVTRIGLGTQIFDHLVIGDPAHPDLVADHVEVQVLVGFTGPRLGLITARGVRIEGRIADGRLSLGEVDKLLTGGAPSTEPFRLPDREVDIRDAALSLATPAGAVTLAFAGKGNLANGFRGGLAMLAPELRFGGCKLTTPVAQLNLRTADGRPHLNGPVGMARLDCGARFAVERPVFALNAVLDAQLDRWHGTATSRAGSLRAGGTALAEVRGHLSFAGDVDRTAGRLEVNATSGTAAPVRAGRIDFEGRYAFGARQSAFRLAGHLALADLLFDDSARYASTLAAARGTPLGPIADALGAALVRAGRAGTEADGDVDLVQTGGAGSLRLSRLALASASGARLVQAGTDGISYGWPSGALSFGGEFALSGGGFPETRVRLSRPTAAGPILGTARIAPMAAGESRLTLGEIAFSTASDGRTSFRTLALLSGPFRGGRVTNLALPVDGRFGPDGYTLGEHCQPIGFQAVQAGSLALGPMRLTLCPAGGAIVSPAGIAAELHQPVLNGHFGGIPLSVGADRLRIGSAGFAAVNLHAAAGWVMRVSRLEAARLDGRFTADGLAGRIDGLAGQLAGVPLRVAEGQGDWRLRGADLGFDGRLILSDTASATRFHPLAAEHLRLALAGNRLHVTSMLTQPASHVAVARATIDQDLGTGAGQAMLDVADLQFTPHFQPETLTPLTVGVVALVDGRISGQGRIQWDRDGMHSSGDFETRNMNLAAPFGPVEGLSSRLHFTDLLGLVSAPHQAAQVRVVHSGIDVFDGTLLYQLRPNLHVAVEGGRWPLAGGTLTIEPSLLDFSRESVKHLTFRIEGLDAAAFVQQLQFSNLSATGTYDGVVPMQFSQQGGRIIGGHLVARAGGGTLSYIGELTDRDLGAYGVLAFDALKSLRYSRLDLTLDGALDGEFLTRIDLEGIARDPQGTRAPTGGLRALVVGRVLNQLSRIPFHFNIRVQGPFRALMATARSFEDPSDFIRASLPQLIQPQPTGPSRTAPDSTVQHQESEPHP